jgi:hypothetical protein
MDRLACHLPLAVIGRLALRLAVVAAGLGGNVFELALGIGGNPLDHLQFLVALEGAQCPHALLEALQDLTQVIAWLRLA